MRKLHTMKETEKNAAQRRRSCKGMTLIECIISILVVGVAGMIMVTAATTVSRFMMETNHVNNKTNVEAPISNAQDIDAVVNGGGTPTQVQISVGKADASGNLTTTYHTFDVDKYNTSVAVAGNDQAVTRMNSNLEFYEVDPTP